MYFLHTLKRAGKKAAVALALVFSIAAASAQADDPTPWLPKYTDVTDAQAKIGTRMQIDNMSVPLKIVGYDEVLGEYLFEASKEYYDQITYQWSPDGVIGDPEFNPPTNVRTAKLTDRATHRNQIYALLRAVYCDWRIPGFRRDIAYKPEYDDFKGSCLLKSDGSMTTSPNQVYKWENGLPKLDEKGEPILVDSAMYVYRKDYHTLKYDPANFFPYFISENDVKLPLNGSTGMLIELTDDYFMYDSISPSGFKTNDVCSRFSKWGDNRKKFMDSIFHYVKAISVIPSQVYIDETVSPDNPGFVFNCDASLSKCFVMTKGCNRALKSYQRLGAGRKPINFYSGEPFYHLFEEYSANNSAPEVNAFDEMNQGMAFPVDHNCGTSIQQQHDIVFAPSVENFSTYNVNLMLFVPDRRFDGETRLHPRDYNRQDTVALGKFSRSNVTYTPYTFYAAEHRPYLYFNKIRAEINTSRLVLDENMQGGKGTEEDPLLADVPVMWHSNYNNIVGHLAPEEFLIYRVIHGNPDSIPVTRKEIELLPITDASLQAGVPGTIFKGDTILSYSDSIYVKVREVVEMASKSDTINRAGNEVSYIIKGRREAHEGQGFVFTTSNVVIGHLPGNNLTLRISEAHSQGYYWEGRNAYDNTIDLIYNGLERPGYPDNYVDGNLLYSDLVSSTSSATNPNLKATQIQPNRDVEIRVYRIKMAGDQKPIPVATFRFPETGEKNSEMSIDAYNWAKRDPDADPNSTVIMANMLLYDYVRDDEGAIVYEDSERLVPKVKVRPFLGEDNKMHEEIYRATDGKVYAPFQGKINFSRLKEQPTGDGSIANDHLPWLPMDSRYDVMASLKDQFSSTISDYENLADRFRYYFCLLPRSARLEVERVEDMGKTRSVTNEETKRAMADGSNDDTNDVVSAMKLSNFANVYVPKRNIFAGFVPYTQEDIDEEALNHDPTNLLQPNKYGLAVHVLNNQNVHYYIIYAHKKDLTTTNQEDFIPIARIDRYPDGYFIPSVYNSNLGTLSQVYQTPNDYNGRVLITGLPEIYDDSYYFTAQIHYYDMGVYAGNTYIMPSVSMPEPPKVEIDDLKIKYIKEEDNGQHLYKCTTSVSSTLPDTYKIYGHGIWYAQKTDEEAFSLIHHPSWAPEVPVSTYSLMADYDDTLPYTTMQSTQTIYQYDMEHPEKATSTVPITFVKTARVYALLDPDSNISVDENSPADAITGYIVADSEKKTFTVTASNVSGIEDIELTEDGPAEYFNLQGIRIPADSLTPGVYIRRAGNSSAKVVIR